MLLFALKNNQQRSAFSMIANLTAMLSALLISGFVFSTKSFAASFEIPIPGSINVETLEYTSCPSLFFALALEVERSNGLPYTGGDNRWASKRNIFFTDDCDLIVENLRLTHIGVNNNISKFTVSHLEWELVDFYVELLPEQKVIKVTHNAGYLTNQTAAFALDKLVTRKNAYYQIFDALMALAVDEFSSSPNQTDLQTLAKVKTRLLTKLIEDRKNNALVTVNYLNSSASADHLNSRADWKSILRDIIALLIPILTLIFVFRRVRA